MDQSTELSEQYLIAAARAATGLERFGDESFLPGLRVMLAGLASEARLNHSGRLRAQSAILMSLKNRLWANACFEAHPEILNRRIVAPVVIVGPMRSGTTRLQRVLAVDDRLQHLTAWEGFNPAPRPGLPDHGRHERHLEVKTFLDRRREVNPAAYAAHPMDADWAEEETLLLNHSFSGFAFLGTYDMPSYRNWYLASDRSDSYRYMVKLLKLISWSRGEPEDKPWLLKAPPHMLALDVLVKEFPDARLLFTHRDPIKTTCSTMSLMWAFYHQNTETPSREALRDIWLDMCERMGVACMRARDALPRAQQFDVYYEEMDSDWRSVMRRIYAFLGLGYDASIERLLAAWIEDSARSNHHGQHRYSLEEFGTTATEVDARMMAYRQRYAIPYESHGPA
ncbi:sulfotransferase family protein [Pseudoduganella namucuonensis]|uniref:Sulfotransferase family protein n=1 Tax=Pseudoduganella namucuonensis TaxID=1035707 RepID=A0A1I7HET9_9BURK|nr:sulfotransferase [Pseudoduganella namucuonensis]SFU59230.1 Sulfotransferase family protein [Pseudoduganella namucuonensis]